MVVQKRVGKEAGLTARRGTLQWGVELIMGRGTLPWDTEPYHGVRTSTSQGTLSWGAEPYHGAGTLPLGAEPYNEMRNPITGRGTL